MKGFVSILQRLGRYLRRISRLRFASAWERMFDREVSAFTFYNIYFATHGVHILLLTAQMKGFMSTFRSFAQPVLSILT